MKSLLSKAHRILFTQLVFVVVAFIAMTVLSCVFMSTIVRENLLRDANGVLNVASTRVASARNEFEATLNNFSEIMRIMMLRGNSVETIKRYVEGMSEADLWDGTETPNIKNFYGYFETTLDGPTLIYGENKTFPEDFIPQDSDWYRLAAGLLCGTVVETTPYRSDDGDTLCTYARCIMDENGRRLGVVCIDVSIATLGAEVVSTALNQGGYGMLVNENFLILSHPNTDFEGRYVYDQTVPLSGKVWADLSNGQEIYEQPMTSYKGEAALVFFRKLPNGWYLGLVTPKNKYYESISSMAIILSLLGLVLASILISILIRIDAAREKSDDENRKKSMFLANMSHEIRTPINAIVGMTAIGRAAGTIERKDYCFSKIDNASKHLLGVVNDILDMSKIKENKIELSSVEFNFEKMLQQVVNVVNFRADEKQQKLTVQIDRAIPKFLLADDQRLAQVITNLLANAIKFTPDGGTVSLKTKLLHEENGVYTVQVEVTDNGIGISPEQQARLFQSFEQGESSTTRKYGGTGLGLAISKTIVELMDGEIWVKSEIARGATFAFTVKVKKGEGTAFDLSSQGINWKNIRIMTVDDDPSVLLYFKEVISNLGATCDVVEHAEDALRLVERTGAYNIYFIDLKMPDIDGISLTKRLREKEIDTRNSIVIMISSADLSTVESEAKKAGVNKFLLKPLFPSAIADVISECIGIVNEKTEKAPQDITGIFAGRHILFAEDVDINREIVLTLLEPTNLKIDCAENGVEAVKMFRQTPEKYDMIFMDIQMPEMDGYEATRQIRASELPSAETVPIVAMTANVFKEDIENCLAAGMNDHLGKPLDMNDLIETTLKYLGNSNKNKEQ